MTTDRTLFGRWRAALVVAGLSVAFGVLQATMLYAGLLSEGELPFEPSFLRILAWQVLSWLVWGALAPAILALGARVRPDRLLRWLAVHLPAALVASVLSAAVGTVASAALRPFGHAWERPLLAELVGRITSSLQFEILVYFGILGASYAVDYYRRFRDRELRAAQLESRLAEARLEALRLQLQPHFLFNTLHTVAGLVRQGESPAAVEMLARLSDLLRATLDGGGRPLVRLREELSLAELYLAIQQVRFADRLRVERAIDPELLDAAVPPFVLQPLLENAVRHGLNVRGRGPAAHRGRALQRPAPPGGARRWPRPRQPGRHRRRGSGPGEHPREAPPALRRGRAARAPAAGRRGSDRLPDPPDAVRGRRVSDPPMAPLRVAIADDEPTARATLRLLLASHSDVEIVAECADGASTVAAVRERRPHLLFLDVQMPEMDGFAVLAELAPEETPAVVFVTAYDEHALRAFEVRALDYLLKPFSDERFERALERARAEIARHGLAELARRIRSLMDGSGAPPSTRRSGAERLLITGTGRTLVVNVEDIDWIEAADYCVRLHVGKRTHLLRRPLADLEADLAPDRFVRIHRSTIVNVERVRQIRPQFKGDAVVDLADGTELRVSRSYREKLLAALGRR